MESDMYKGPINMGVNRYASRTEKVNLGYYYQVDTSESGSATKNIFSTDLTNDTDWGKYGNLYKQYRILGMEVEWRPNIGLSNATKAHNMTILTQQHFSDVSTYSPPTGYTEALSTPNHVIRNTGVPSKIVVRARGNLEMNFTDTYAIGDNALWAVNFIAENLTPSTTYGNLVVRWIVEFRERT